MEDDSIDGFNPDEAPLPEGVLPEVKKVLSKLILEDFTAAWDYLVKDPLAIVALSSVLKDIKQSHPESYTEFKETYDLNLLRLFDISWKFPEHGIGLTIELLLGLWRKENQSIDINSINDLILQNLHVIRQNITNMENTPSNRVIYEILEDSIRRVESLHQYEESKSEDIVKRISQRIRPIIEEEFKDLVNRKNEEYLDWLSVATMKNIFATELRKGIADIVYQAIKTNFETFNDDQKFKTAPWLAYLERIIGKTEINKSENT